METKDKIILATGSLIVASGFVASLVLGTAGKINFCDSEGSCTVLSKTQYTSLKRALADKVLADQPLTIEEWQQYTGIVNNEARKGLNLTSAGSKDEIRYAIAKKMKE